MDRASDKGGNAQNAAGAVTTGQVLQDLVGHVVDLF